MSPFLYRRPNTGDNVQAWADDEPDDDDFTYVQVRCFACAQTRLVNLKTAFFLINLGWLQKDAIQADQFSKLVSCDCLRALGTV